MGISPGRESSVAAVKQLDEAISRILFWGCPPPSDVKARRHARPQAGSACRAPGKRGLRPRGGPDDVLRRGCVRDERRESLGLDEVRARHVR